MSRDELEDDLIIKRYDVNKFTFWQRWFTKKAEYRKALKELRESICRASQYLEHASKDWEEKKRFAGFLRQMESFYLKRARK